MLVECPVCDGHGYLYRARVERLGVELRICEECEATWLPCMEVSKSDFVRLTAYLRERGFSLKEAGFAITGPTPSMQWREKNSKRKQ